MSVAATIGAVGSIASGGIGAIGASKAAGAQASAARAAQQIEEQKAQSSLDFQNKEWDTQQQNQQPFLKAGQTAIGELSGLTSTPGEGLLTPWTQEFKAPTAAEAEQTPGYQFQLKEGEQQLQNSAAASGGLLTGGTAKAINDYAQGRASSNYQQTYENALTQYQSAYNTFQNNQNNTFNRLRSVSDVGQTSAGQLGQEGQAAASNVASVNMNAGQQEAQALENRGAATASGYAGVTNALTGTVSGVTNALTMGQLMSQNNNPYLGNASTSGLQNEMRNTVYQ